MIVEVEINNSAEYAEYKKLTPSSISAYDENFIVRGGQTEALEGEWEPERIVVLEFPDIDKARKWWSSQEYAVAKQICQRAAKTKMLLVEGYTA